MNKQILKRVQEHYNYIKQQGYEIVCTCLQGSQNYELDEYSDGYQSDVDTKSIILPNFKDFVDENEPISTTLILENGEHAEIKDIRTMFNNFKKQNISYIELLYSKYIIINPKYKKLIQPLFDNREEVAAIDIKKFVKCIAGMSMEKRKALCHPYPGTIEKIEKYGFDGKQLSHCARLNEFLYLYMNNIPLKSCFISNNKQKLMNYKKQLTGDGSRIMTKEEAIMLCNLYDEDTKAMKEQFMGMTDFENKEGLDLLEKIKYNILKRKFKEDLKKERRRK